LETAPEKAELISRFFSGLTDLQQQQFQQLYDLYKDWNSKINVISRKDIEHIYLHHVLHSLAIARVAFFEKGAEVLDIGTGGGFPAIPLAIMFPGNAFLAIDSIGKKINVVNEVANALELKNISARHSRVQEVRGSFPYIVSRAVAPSLELLQWSKHLRMKDVPTFYYFLKGGDLTSELKAVRQRKQLYDIHELFPFEYFKEKYVVEIIA
jgi:16S rRNA (guanine527-N7)-methyltransferase